MLFADFHDSEFRKQFVNKQTEVVMLSMKVSKYNKYNWVQERNFVVTQDNIYIFKHKKLKRFVQISFLQGITKSLHINSREVVLHFFGNHDVRIKSDERDKLIFALKIAYTTKAKRNLSIYGIKSKDLHEFTTTEKDLERGISRIPL